MTTQELHIGDTVRTYSGEIGTVLSGPWMDNENGEQLCTVKVGDRCFPHGVAELEIVKASNGILEAIKKVNERLLKGEPGNISENKYSSYASSGYKSQHIVDALNLEMGIGQWGFEETEHTLVYDCDNKPIVALATVKVWLAGVDAQFCAHGQCSIQKNDIGDAQKGAVTDALKKGLAYFSIGNRAFHGLLKGGTKESNKG
jgi:hypothetical protein